MVANHEHDGVPHVFEPIPERREDADSRIADTDATFSHALDDYGTQIAVMIEPYDERARRDGHIVGQWRTEQPTGSGCWSLEPSVTLSYPTDTVVIFAHVSYT